MRGDGLCNSSLCGHDYPHTHVRPEGGNPSWFASIDDPAVSAPWPDRLQWRRAVRGNGNPFHLFKFGWFASHSGFQLPWKLDLENLRDEDWEAIAEIIAWKFAFCSVYGVPKGGVRLAQALDKHVTPGYPVLIVDDVLTTGRSMIEAKAALGNPQGAIGVVVAARGRCPDWVWPILQVSEWAQSRATGLG